MTSDDPDDPKLNPGDQGKPGTPGTGENICPDCGGSGKIGAQPCRTCGGTGKVIEGGRRRLDTLHPGNPSFDHHSVA
jgi:hypothetical protein